MGEDTRRQLPIYWNELGTDAQTDLLHILVDKYGYNHTKFREILDKMEKHGECVGHVVIYESDIERWGDL